jgi:hypothetical protein
MLRYMKKLSVLLTLARSTWSEACRLIIQVDLLATVNILIKITYPNICTGYKFMHD